MSKFTKFKFKARMLLYSLFLKSPRLSSIYYTFLSGGFHEEHFAVVSGIYKNKNETLNMGNFRRSIHRIEKGLITSPSKPVFAESYILETVLNFRDLVQMPVDNSTKEWAIGILQQYFDTVRETEITKNAKTIFLKVKRDEKIKLPVTYMAFTRSRSKISYTDFLQLTRQRRSVRYYEDKPVPRNLVENAIRAALQSPSACNRQPFMYRIIDDPGRILEAARLPNGSEVFAQNIKMMVFLIGDLSNYFDERDKHLIYIDGALSAQSFILALETLGLSSCIINWSDIPSNNYRLKTFLQLEDWERCVMSISVGYADPNSGIPSSVKKDIKTVVRYN
ncbi:MAG: nitroreductase family protein [Prolixibacteraceae bacterium]